MTQPLSAQHFADPVAASAYAAYRQAQIEEYSQYEAISNITQGGIVLFAANAPVPASTVAAHPWLEPLVRRTAPAPQPGVDRAEQLKLRRAQLEEEAAAIEAELAAQEADDEIDQDESRWESMTIAEMRTELADRGLPTSGNKSELLERLHADDDKPTDDDTDESPQE